MDDREYCNLHLCPKCGVADKPRNKTQCVKCPGEEIEDEIVEEPTIQINDDEYLEVEEDFDI